MMRAMRILRNATLGIVALTGFFFFLLAPLVDRVLNRVVAEPLAPVSDDVQQFHQSLVVGDLHADQLLWTRDLLKRSSHGHVDLPRLQEGNVAIQVFSVVSKTPRGLNYERNDDRTDNATPLAMASRWPVETWRSLRARALYQAVKLRTAERESRGALVLLRSRADVESLSIARQGGKRMVGAVLAAEGLQILEGQLANVDTLYAAGFRMLGLTHFFDNEVAGSAHGMNKGGLTDLGRAVIKRMEERRILVDVAHASPSTIDDVLAMATRPVVVSHTGVRATCPGTRNLTDDQLRRIATTGGVIGIGFWDAAVCDIEPASIARAIVHAVKVAGVDHVALGSDFDGSTKTRFDAAGLVHITAALRAANMADDDVAKVMGGNVVRLLTYALPER